MFFIITKKDYFLSPPEMQIKNTTKVKDPADLWSTRLFIRIIEGGGI